VWDAVSGDQVFTTSVGTWADDIAWSPDGDLLAIAGGEGDTGSVTIVDRSGRTIDVIREDRGVAAGSVAFSADGAQLIMSRLPRGRHDPATGQLVVWDREAGEVVQTLDTAPALAVPSPSGDLIATTSREGAVSHVVEVWRSSTGQRAATLAGHTGRVLDLAFDVDGSRLATASTDGTVRVWDPDTGEALLVLRGHDGLVSSVAFSPDGAQLASASADGTVRVWALELDDLIEIAARELTRTLVDGECRQYLHIERCP
jgi:WD40 repeat protein